MSRVLSAPAALDRYFLETRCKLIEIAANLDRIDEGQEAAPTQHDRRLHQIRHAINILLEEKPGRAERCQMIFSQPYDPSWTVPNKR